MAKIEQHPFEKVGLLLLAMKKAGTVVKNRQMTKSSTASQWANCVSLSLIIPNFRLGNVLALFFCYPVEVYVGDSQISFKVTPVQLQKLTTSITVTAGNPFVSVLHK